MKKTAIIPGSVFGVLILTALLLHAIPHSAAQGAHQATSSTDNETVTIKLNQTRLAICGRPFFDAFYALTKNVFTVGAENVDLNDYQNQVFNLIRTSDTLDDSSIDREGLIEHIQGIPRQMIDIVKDDPEVLNSCENFSVAMAGPQ